MPRGPKADFFGAIRAQAAKVLKQLETKIHALESELTELRGQLQSWRQLAGGAMRSMGVGGARRLGRPVGRPPGSGRGRSGQRVKWDEVLEFVPKRFGVQDVMKHPGAAAKGRAQVYPALNRWEGAKRIRRVGKGLYEKAGSGSESPTAKRATRGKRSSGKKRAVKRRKSQAAKPGEAKAS